MAPPQALLIDAVYRVEMCFSHQFTFTLAVRAAWTFSDSEFHTDTSAHDATTPIRISG
jgi:hypothetical protein